MGIDRENIDIAKHSYTETMAWCRHWDTIRWTVVAAMLAAMASSIFSNTVKLCDVFGFSITVNDVINLVLTVFSLYLLRNLRIYHAEIVAGHNCKIENLDIEQPYKMLLMVKLPFEFSTKTDREPNDHTVTGKRLRITATALLPWVIVILAIASTVIIRVKNQ